MISVSDFVSYEHEPSSKNGSTKGVLNKVEPKPSIDHFDAHRFGVRGSGSG